jgi:hypothetical protein
MQKNDASGIPVQWPSPCSAVSKAKGPLSSTLRPFRGPVAADTPSAAAFQNPQEWPVSTVRSEESTPTIPHRSPRLVIVTTLPECLVDLFARARQKQCNRGEFRRPLRSEQMQPGSYRQRDN